MSDKQKNIDQIFKDKLENIEVVPDPSVWNSIEASLDKKRRKAVIVWIKRSGVAAVVAIAFALGWFFSERTIDRTFVSEVQPEYTINPFKITANQPVHLRIVKSGYKKIEGRTDYMLVAEQRKEEENDLYRMSAKSMRIYSPGIKEPKLSMLKDELSTLDRQIIAMNLAQIEDEKLTENSKGRWMVGAQVAPSYTFNTEAPSKNAQYELFETVNSAENVTSDYQSTFAGVINVAFEKNSRLKFETGIGYRSITQSLGTYNVTNGNNNLLSFADFYASELKSATVNTITMQTDLGVATVSLPSGTQVSTTQARIYNSPVQNAAFEDYDVNQYANYLEVPFNIFYKLLDKKIDISAIGGVNTNILMNDYLTLNGTNNNYKGGEIIGLNTLTFSSNLGVGIEYEWMKRIRLSLEPILKIQLNSLNKSAQFNARPLNFGLYSGLRYVF